ncbi:histone-like nucleoid-structuring protein Lsr2 [Pseudarthrobacter sp. S9]|uniref:histone-like nucleoid-structuring protein Lsr2 n=1 Tax=Pseudarthrobacter sp. S9 TaxID=3418421 RepID=UPI003D01E381
MSPWEGAGSTSSPSTPSRSARSASDGLRRPPAGLVSSITTASVDRAGRGPKDRLIYGGRKHEATKEQDPRARKVHVQLVDDISGEEAQETVTFALDSVDYEIDLTDVNAAELREQLKGYIAHARRLRGASVRRGPKTASISREETRRIGEWA